jgi:nucleotide-binding universal stress UspA family protein
MKRILVATDGSAGADRAIDVAAGLAKQLDGELLIVHVSESTLPADWEKFRRAEKATVNEMLNAAGGELLARARLRAEQAGAPRVRTRSSIGDAAEFILDTARKERADAIVVGKRGHGRLAGLLVGSISQKLVSVAPCNVVVVP